MKNLYVLVMNNEVYYTLKLDLHLIKTSVQLIQQQYS